MSEEKKDPNDKGKKAAGKAGDAAKDAKDSVKGAAGKAKAAAKDTANKAKQAAKETGEKAREAAGEAKEKAADFKQEAKKTADEFTEGLKEAGGENKKILAGILAILLGGFGIHKFILGYQKEGIILLVLSLIGIATTCLIFGSFILMATWAVGVIEGIIYLTKSDEEFYNTYQAGKKPWF